MLRLFNLCLCVALVGLAYGIYQVKYDTRSFDVEIEALSKDIEAERDSVAVLRAEWSLLNRPERIERLAEKYLELQSPKPQQMLALESASPGDVERAAIALATPETPTGPTAPKTTSKPAPATTGSIAAKPVPKPMTGSIAARTTPKPAMSSTAAKAVPKSATSSSAEKSATKPAAPDKRILRPSAPMSAATQ
jgi:cell division protein FtsL